jgi:malonate decarboxylase gamma subunit
VFAPGPENYLRMGGLAAIWGGDLAGQLLQALSVVRDVDGGNDAAVDNRAALGAERGGRNWSQRVVQAIVSGSHVSGP